MDHNKYKELKGMVDDIHTKLDAQHKVVNGLMLIFQDSDAQVQTLKDFMIKANIMSEVDYNKQVDDRRGLRLMGATDVIAAGDTVWVDYVAHIDGTEVGADKGLPLRVGSGAVNFEPAVVGRHVGEILTHDHIVREEGEFKGKTVNFTITILKAKTKIAAEATDGPTTTTTDPSAEARGPGNEDVHTGEDRTLQQGEPGVGAEAGLRSVPTGVGVARHDSSVQI